MNKHKKQALLDTDFVFKAHIARNSSGGTLADIVSSFEDYEFLCHEKILEELEYHDISPDPLPWIKRMIQDGKLHPYTDADILDMLAKAYGYGAENLYIDFLKNSCAAFASDFFQNYYSALDALGVGPNRSAMLAALGKCDAAIPRENSMGEKKTFVLLQASLALQPDNVYVFCSDDRKARQKIISIDASVKCLSILALLLKLKRLGFARESIKSYYDSLCAFYSAHDQTQMKVWESGITPRMTTVDFQPLFEDIWNNRLICLQTGDLKYQ